MKQIFMFNDVFIKIIIRLHTSKETGWQKNLGQCLELGHLELCIELIQIFSLWKYIYFISQIPIQHICSLHLIYLQLIILYLYPAISVMRADSRSMPVWLVKHHHMPGWASADLLNNFLKHFRLIQYTMAKTF